MIQNKYSENRITAINRVLLNLWLTKHNKRVLFPYIRVLGRRMCCWSSLLPWSHSCTQSHRGFAGFNTWLPGHSHKETDFFSQQKNAVSSRFPNVLVEGWEEPFLILLCISSVVILLWLCAILGIYFFSLA